MHDVTHILVDHYESTLAAHGPTAAGMDWGSDESRLALRFDAIFRALSLDRPGPRISVLDAGCGCGLLFDRILQRCPARVAYIGVDASSRMIESARRRHPQGRWIESDMLDPVGVSPCDYVVANGLLTERREVDESRMIEYARTMLKSMFDLCRIGMVFNVLSSHVNFRDANLLYWDPGEVLAFVAAELSRHVVVYHDLELYECFYLVRRTPWPGESGGGDE